MVNLFVGHLGKPLNIKGKPTGNHAIAFSIEWWYIIGIFWTDFDYKSFPLLPQLIKNAEHAPSSVRVDKPSIRFITRRTAWLKWSMLPKPVVMIDKIFACQPGFPGLVTHIVISSAAHIMPVMPCYFNCIQISTTHTSSQRCIPHDQSLSSGTVQSQFRTSNCAPYHGHCRRWLKRLRHSSQKQKTWFKGWH